MILLAEIFMWTARIAVLLFCAAGIALLVWLAPWEVLVGLAAVLVIAALYTVAEDYCNRGR